MYLYIRSAAAAAVAALCVALLLLLQLQQLLLFVIVCRMAKIVAGLMNLNRQLSLNEHLCLAVRSPACSLFFISCAVFFLFFFGAVWFHTRVPVGPDIPGIYCWCVTYYIPGMYLYRVRLPLLLLFVLLYFCCCCSSCCCSSSRAEWQKLLSLIHI